MREQAPQGHNASSAPGERQRPTAAVCIQSTTSVQTVNGPERYISETAANAPYAIIRTRNVKIAPRPYMDSIIR